MEISEHLLLIRLKYSWFGVKSSSGQASTEVCQANVFLAIFLLLPAPHYKTHTHTYGSVSQNHKRAKPWGWFPHQNIREKPQI